MFVCVQGQRIGFMATAKDDGRNIRGSGRLSDM